MRQQQGQQGRSGQPVTNPAFNVVQEISFENLCDFTPEGEIVPGTEDYDEPLYGTMEIEGVKQIRPLNPSKFKQPVNVIRRYKDLTTNTVFGIPIKKNPDGTYLYKKLVINENGMYDLKDRMQAMEFHVLKTAPFMKDSPYNFTGTPALYYVHDENEQALAAIAKRKLVRQAEDFLEQLTDSKVIDYGRVFKIDPQRNTVAVIRNMLYEKAIKNPNSIISLFKDAAYTRAAIVLNRAKAMGIVSETVEGVKSTSGVVMGMTELTATQFLTANPQMLRALDNESLQVEKNIHNLTKRVVVDKTMKQSLQNQTPHNPQIDNFLKKNADIVKKKVAQDERQEESFKVDVATDEEEREMELNNGGLSFSGSEADDNADGSDQENLLNYKEETDEEGLTETDRKALAGLATGPDESPYKSSPKANNNKGQSGKGRAVKK